MDNLRDRQPRRYKYISEIVIYLGFGIIFLGSIVLSIISPIFFLLALIPWNKKNKIPIEKMNCSFCGREWKVELNVRQFICLDCMNTLSKKGDKW